MAHKAHQPLPAWNDLQVDASRGFAYTFQTSDGTVRKLKLTLQCVSDCGWCGHISGSDPCSGTSFRSLQQDWNEIQTY